MGAYDSRRITLDSGLTSLAIRGLRNPDGCYPFIERHIGRRRYGTASSAFRVLLTTWFQTVRTLLAARPTTT